MKTKVILRTRSKLESIETFRANLEKEIDFYVQQGLKVVASNITVEGAWMYAYVLLVKE